jgi:hypothetical protein
MYLVPSSFTYIPIASAGVFITVKDFLSSSDLAVMVMSLVNTGNCMDL